MFPLKEKYLMLLAYGIEWLSLLCSKTGSKLDDNSECKQSFSTLLFGHHTAKQKREFTCPEENKSATCIPVA